MDHLSSAQASCDHEHGACQNGGSVGEAAQCVLGLQTAGDDQ
ncbi:hypothetical protein SDC9_88074 [bioreactor metagenome]|uniref:Uncharacterized protein n=1 Tax=bioreactor metagenome TaxID=1076179 RepID=A0A644ZKM0_9ZZZZ